jgi:DNA-binding Lrp family transcriptional regulator
MILKPQDVLVLLKLVSIYPQEWAYNTLAVDLAMSPSEVHAAVKRSVKAGLANQRELQINPNISRLEEFLVYGIQYVFVPDRGELTRGMPTTFAAMPLLGKIIMPDEPVPVWPDPVGPERGQAFSPLYKSVPKAARSDAILYEYLVIVDAIRGGRARERELAIKELKMRFRQWQ